MGNVQKRSNDAAGSASRASQNIAPSGELNSLTGLQQAVGNRGMLQLLGATALQSKPKTAQRSNQYEEEANEAARVIEHSTGAAVQLKCAACAGGAPCSACAGKDTKGKLQLKPDSGEMVQRSPQTGATAAAGPSEAEAAAEPEPAANTRTFIVEDDAQEIAPGQMRKSDFLSQLRTATCIAAEDALSGTMWSAMGCPYIERWFDYYQNKPGAHVERALRKYAPETASARSAEEYIPLVTDRVRRGIGEWTTTGEVSQLPEEFAGGEMPGATVGGMVSGLLSGADSAFSGVMSGARRALSSVGGMLFKDQASRSGDESNPELVRAQLSTGQSLEGGVQKRMESAFGHDFSHVRVHADGGAAQVSEGLGARAFTVGHDVAFGAGEYKPGTPVGDALIAHELAHVVQQSGSSTAPMKKGGAEYNSLEDDADRAAVGAVMSQWGGKGLMGSLGQAAMPQLKSGLRLSRCSNKSETAASAPKKTVTVNVTYLSGGSTDLSTHLAKANDVFKQADVEVKAGKSETLDETKSKAILGNDLVLEEYSDPASPTTEEQELLKVNRTAGTITMYYVKGMSAGSYGEAFWASTGQPLSFVYASPNSRTFPHELGHVLLNDGAHPGDADNFMAQTGGASGKDIMTADQIKTIRANSLVK